MAFNSNDSIDILIKARAEGADQIRGLDSSTKAYIATNQQLQAMLDKNASVNASLGKSIDTLAASMEKLGKSTKKSSQDAGDGLDEFAKKLNTLMGNPAYAVNSPFALAGRAVSQFAQALGPAGTIALGAGVAFSVVAGSVLGLINHFAEGETALRNFALRLDLPIATARQLQIEAKLTGVNIATLEAGVRTLSAAFDDPGGAGKKQAAILREMGIATRELDGSDRALGAGLLDVFNKLSEMSNATQRAHDGTVLLGRGFKELLPAIELHSQLSSRAIQLAAAYDDNVNPAFVKARSTIEELGIEFDALEKDLLAKLIPTLVKAANLVQHILPTPKTPGDYKDGQFDKVQARTSLSGLFVSGFGEAIFGKDSYERLNPEEIDRMNKAKIAQAQALTGAQALSPTNVGLSQETSFIDQKYLNPLEKMESKLKEIKGEIAELNKGGIVPIADLAKYDSLKKDQSTQEAKIKSYKDSISYQKELTRALQEYGAEAAKAEGGELSMLQKLEAERKSALSVIDEKFHGDPRLKADKNREFDAREDTQRTNEYNTSVHEAAEQQVAALEHQASVQGRLIEVGQGDKKTKADITKELERQLALIEQIYEIESNDPKDKDADDRRKRRVDDVTTNAQVQTVQVNNRDARAAEEHQNRLISIQDEANNKQYQNQASFAQRLLTVKAKPGDEIATAQQVEQIQFDLEQKRLEMEQQRAQLEGNTDKASELALKLRLSDEENILKIREEGELRIAELQKKDREEFEQGAAKLFDALTGKNGGLSKLFTTELTSLEKTLFTNSAGILFDQTGGKGLGLSSLVPGQRGADGKLNPLGQLLQGTPFGDKGINSTATAQVNTASYTLRTAVAVERIASASGTGSGVAGSPGGGIGIPGVSGSNGISSVMFSGAPGANGSSGVDGSAGSDGSDIFGISGGTSGWGQLASYGGPAPSVSSAPGGSGVVGQQGPNGASQFLGGALGLATGNSNIFSVLSGNSTASGAAQAGTVIGAAGTVIAGVEGAIKGFSKGGVGGISSGIASVAGTAAALDPEPISKAALAGVALVSEIVGQIFGSNQEKRANDIAAYVANNNTSNQYITNPITGKLSLNPNYRGQSMEEDYDISGNQAIYNSNGGVTAAGSTVVHNWNVSTLSPQAFMDASGPITDAVNNQMQLGHPVNNTIAQKFLQ